MPRFAVIGLGTFGQKVALTLTAKGANVIAVDRDQTRIEEIKDQVAVALVLNATDENALRAAQIENVDAAVVALGEAQEEAILTTAILKKMKIAPIIARASNQLYGHVLTMVGADRVINIEEQMGEEVAKSLVSPELHEIVPLASGHSIAEIEITKDLTGRNLRQLNLRNKYNLNIIAIRRPATKIDEDGKVVTDFTVNDLPGPQDTVEENDILIVVGSDSDIEKFLGPKKKR